MKGLEISRLYWEECGKPTLELQMPHLMEKIAVGLIGSGSECYGYDDEISRDHDFEPGFCIFLPDEKNVTRREEFLLERLYNSLPTEFMGIQRAPLSPAGGNRHGVFRTEKWYEKMTGYGQAPKSWKEFFSLPDFSLAEVINGEVFFDDCGEFTKIRDAWQHPPEDYIRKKICGNLLSMSQTGEYNYPRCLQRSDFPSAHLTADEFVKACLGAAFWSEGKPVPYYKWTFRALKDLSFSPLISPYLENILFGINVSDPIDSAKKAILQILNEKMILPNEFADLQQSAFFLNDKIKDFELKSMSPLATV